MHLKRQNFVLGLRPLPNASSNDGGEPAGRIWRAPEKNKRGNCWRGSSPLIMKQYKNEGPIRLVLADV
jgi:hypothetical protein